MDDIWIYGYGSLMWRPGFDYVEARPALLRGYHRALCVYSVRYRGTRALPGLVLGLDHGGACAGMAFRVAGQDAEQVLSYLDQRETPTDAYRRRLVAVAAAGERVRAYAYIVNRDSPQYTGRLSADQTVALIVQGEGQMGRCLDYVENTVRHLELLGYGDGHLHDLLARALRQCGAGRPTENSAHAQRE